MVGIVGKQAPTATTNGRSRDISRENRCLNTVGGTSVNFHAERGGGKYRAHQFELGLCEIIHLLFPRVINSASTRVPG